MLSIRRTPISVARLRFVRRLSAAKETEYERKTPLEHVMLRPGMYVGQTNIAPLETWTVDEKFSAMEKRTVNISPALLKVFDEILVNAADNRQRDTKMTKIEIDVSIANNSLSVSVLNDGKGIPVQMHKKENLYIPELVFGHLLTGSNFDDSVSRLTGGSHGYGAKLTNMFSTTFSVETYDAQRKLLFEQAWSTNMTQVGQARVSKAALPGSYTKISFQPDLAKLGYSDVSAADLPQALGDVLAVFRRRAADVAGSLSGAVQVVFNSQAIPVSSFKDYVALFGSTRSADTTGEAAADPFFYANVNKRWEVAVKRSPSSSFESMSFVNNVWTIRGGTHVNLLAAQLTRAIEEALRKKDGAVYPTLIKSKLMVFVNCQVENPSFEGQSKEQLNTKPQAYGSECVLSPQFLKSFVRESGIVESILDDVAVMERRRLAASAKTSGRKQVTDVPKLEDAHLAGGPRASECTLILTEGDSAKALAVAGFEVVRRQHYGVLPLRGKVLNVRVATKKQLSANEELLSLCKALGLDFNRKYSRGLADANLRYGKVLIMCDQDSDGSHIKGLLINLFHYFWPSLLRHTGFLQQFITPIVKVSPTSGGESKRAAGAKAFYSLPEYEEWRRKIGAENIGKWNVKYYKGLGTNTAEEGRQYFSALDKHRKNFVASSSGEGSSTSDDCIDLAFSKSRAEDRKQWLLSKFDPAAYIDPHKPSVSIEEFVDKELIQFSYADNVRSIPSVVDGLKPSQRKVLYGCFRKNLNDEAKVVQIAGYISEQTAYHHGEASLHAAIVNMAQDFVGSNNVPLLIPSGQFGTRAQGGKDFASPRYIFTRLSPIARALFPQEDDALLTYEEEDGLAVEPRFFLPVVPTLLLNGSAGIGTGWSTNVPSYNISDVIRCVRNKLAGKRSAKGLVPWTRGFKGRTLVDKDANRFTSVGVAKRLDATTVSISELPVGRWTDDYKETLCGMTEKGTIKSFTEHHTSEGVEFEVKVAKSSLDELEAAAGGLEAVFRLETPISTSNMHAFDPAGVITRYASPEQIIDVHFDLRLRGYERRKAAMERALLAEEMTARNKSQFIGEIVSGRLSLLSADAASGRLRSVPERDLVEELRRKGFATHGDIQAAREGSQGTAAAAAAGGGGGRQHGYEYLLTMGIHSLTEDRSVALGKAAAEAVSSLEATRALGAKDLWLRDLTSLEKRYKELYK